MDKGNLLNFIRKLRIEVVHEAESGWLTCRCPFAKWLHGGKTDEKPSFFARADVRKKSGYNCYTCHKSGNIVQLIKSLEHYRKREYPGLDLEVQIAEVKAGVSFDYDLDVDADEPEPIEEVVFEGLFTPAWKSKVARSYLKNDRMISAETAELLGLLYDPMDMRIMFPVRGRRQELYGFSGRTILPKSHWPKTRGDERPYGKIKDYYGLKKRKLLLGLHLRNPKLPSLMVEGLFAYAAMFEEGCDRLGSPIATLGSTLSPEQAAMFVEWGKAVYAFYDNDKAGKRGLFGYIDADGVQRKGAAHHLCGEIPFFVPKWPNGLSDPDDLEFTDVRRMTKRAELFTAPPKLDKRGDLQRN